MPDFPSGTVTFLFTDLEGSTRLLKRLRTRYGDLLADHHRLLRAAFKEANGREIDNQGEAFFVAFRRARDGVAAAVAAQRALAAHEWPDGVEVRVRMGLHTGEPSLTETGFVSLAVHRGARICAAGHGGQVLLSHTTRDLVEDELLPDVTLHDLGEYRLKDFDRPERISQLVIDGLPSDFPPLRTEAERAPEPPFGGQEAEFAEAVKAAVGRPRLPRRTAVAVAAAVLLAAVLATVLATRGGAPALTVAANSVAVIDPQSGRVVDAVPVGQHPGSLAFASGSLWVANVDDGTISRIDPAQRIVTRTFAVGSAPVGLAPARGGLWFTSGEAPASSLAVARIDPRFNTIERTGIHIRGLPLGGGSGGTAAAGTAALWLVPGGSGTLTRLDLGTRRLTTVAAGDAPTAVALGYGSVWVTDVVSSTVVRIDMSTLALTARIPVAHGPTGIAVGAGAVWVAASVDHRVVRIDPDTNSVTTTIPVGTFPSGVAVGAGSVWVANSRSGSVSRIDPRTNRVVSTIHVGASPSGIAVGAGHVWTTVEAASAARGGEIAAQRDVARLNSQVGVYSLDPAIASDPLAWQIEYATCAKLLNYPDLPRRAGTRLVPELARTMNVSNGGRTYTFAIRSGFRFSPPSNAAVTAQSLRRTIERTLDPRMRSPAAALGGTIVGIDSFRAGRTKHIAGITARGATLTIRLTLASPTFPDWLAQPYFCAVPADTPIGPVRAAALPSAGPYFVESYTPGRHLVLRRNPNYGGSRPRKLAGFAITIDVAKEQTLPEIESGAVDYALDGVPAQAIPRLAARYGAGSTSAKAGRQQFFVNHRLGLDYLDINESRPLFADVRARRALNYAIDRRALAQLGTFANPWPTPPADQYLPPTMPGFRDEKLYPATPDPAKARRLLGGRRGTAVLLVCDISPCPQAAQIITDNLVAIGIGVDVRTFSPQPFVRSPTAQNGPYDLALAASRADSADPGQFLLRLLAATSARGGPPGSSIPAFARRLNAAAQLTGARRETAFGALDVALARDVAPLVAIDAPTSQDFFSARIGCQIYNAVYRIDLAALCIRP